MLVAHDFHKGDRVKLIAMSDTYPDIPIQSRGTVQGIAGHNEVSVRWDSGRTIFMLLNNGDEIAYA